MLNINAFSTINSNAQIQFKGSSTKANSKEAATIIRKSIFIGGSYVGHIMSEIDECIQKKALPFFWKKIGTCPGEKTCFKPFIYMLADEEDEIQEVIEIASQNFEGRVAVLSDGINNKKLESLGFKTFLKEEINNIETRLKNISKPEQMPKKAEALKIRQYEIENLTKKLERYKKHDKDGSVPEGIEGLLMYRDDTGIIY